MGGSPNKDSKVTVGGEAGGGGGAGMVAVLPSALARFCSAWNWASVGKVPDWPACCSTRLLEKGMDGWEGAWWVGALVAPLRYMQGCPAQNRPADTRHQGTTFPKGAAPCQHLLAGAVGGLQVEGRRGQVGCLPCRAKAMLHGRPGVRGLHREG